MLLSGSVGFTLLSNKDINKTILILADVHDGVNYCKNDSVMIDRWLAYKSLDNDVLLEEAIREGLSLTDLWPGAVHTQRLKQLNRLNPKIKPVDIRPLLIPYSWELLYTNNKPELNNTPLNKYLQNIDDLYNFRKTKLMMKYIVPEIKKLLDNSIKKKLLIHFNEMKDYYMDYINDNEYLNKTIKEIYDTNKDILEDINNMTTMIMEWYILLLLFNSNTNSIVHLGLAHSNRLLDFLQEIYNFSVMKKSGVNEIAEITDNPKACIIMPDDIK